MGMSALARRVKMSAPAVTERVQRLERAGVITGYRLDINPAALGLPSPHSLASGRLPANSARLPISPARWRRSPSVIALPARTAS
jgi:Lrp/AsnC family leucine-responsive transcriptional regulator